MPRKPASISKSINAKIEGFRPIEEFRVMVHEAICNFQGIGVTHVKSGLLNFVPCDNQGRPLARVGETALQDVTIKEPYRSVADEHGL